MVGSPSGRFLTGNQFPPPSLRLPRFASGCAGKQRERRDVSGGRGSIENRIGQARHRPRRYPRRFGKREQIDMVARVLLTAQEAGALKLGEPVRSILARALGPGTGGGALLGGIDRKSVVAGRRGSVRVDPG